MAQAYRDLVTQNFLDRCEALLETVPPFVKDFFIYTEGKSRTARTRHAYLIDVIAFLKYECDVATGVPDLDVSEFPLEVLDLIRIQDIMDYQHHLLKIQFLEPASVKRKMSSLSMFFKFLASRECIHQNPMAGFEAPKLDRHRIITLDSELCAQLLDGVLANDRYKNEFINVAGTHYANVQTACRANQVSYDEVKEYAAAHNCTYPAALSHFLNCDVYEDYEIIDMPDDVKMTKEMFVLRNYAIIVVFLGTGLRVSELVGLDLGDIHWRDNMITTIKKGGADHEVFFGAEVEDALRLYIDGPSPDLSMLDRYENAAQLKIFCEQNRLKANIEGALKKAKIEYTDQMLRDINLAIASLSRCGRSGFINRKKKMAKADEKALFLSSHGTRMSVRSCELMIKEMVQTYLPDYDDKDIFSPHKLRATAATRILAQTNSISLASEQLGHSDVGITSRAYAEMLRRNRKEKIAELSLFGGF